MTNPVLAAVVGFITAALVVLTVLFVGFRPHPKEHPDKKTPVLLESTKTVQEASLVEQDKLPDETVLSAYDETHGLGIVALSNGVIGTLRLVDGEIKMTSRGLHHEYDGIPRNCDIVPGTNRAWIRTDSGVDVLFLSDKDTWHAYHHEPNVFSASVTKTSVGEFLLVTEKGWLDVSEVAVTKRHAATRGMWPKSVRNYMKLTPGVVRVQSDGAYGHVTLSNPNEGKFIALSWVPSAGQFATRWDRNMTVFHSLVSEDLRVVAVNADLQLVVMDPETIQTLHEFTTSSIHLSGSRPMLDRLLAVEPSGTAYLWRRIAATNTYLDAPADEPIVLAGMSDVAHVSTAHLLNRDHVYRLRTAN